MVTKFTVQENKLLKLDTLQKYLSSTFGRNVLLSCLFCIHEHIWSKQTYV